MGNPYNLTFGIMPSEYISRLVQMDEIVKHFTAEPATSQSYIITGVRGSGKTVMLTELSQKFKNDGWIVIDLNPNGDMLKSMASKLYAESSLHNLFVKAQFNFSVLGVGVSFEKNPPVTDYETAIDMMLGEAAKHGKKVLVTVDEITNNGYVRQFASAFQIFIRAGHPLFFLATGLYKNVSNLQNDKTLTFLYRMPKIQTEPLNISAIRASYEKNIGLDSDKAREYAQLTKGYPYAYQVIGYLLWENGGSDDGVIADLDQYLQEYVYNKIWDELSPTERDIAGVLAKTGDAQVADVREALSMDSPEFSVYRDSMKKKGVIDTSCYGRVSLALPRFDEYVKDIYN